VSGDPLDDWMSEEEAAAAVQKTVRTLRDWRQRREGPPYARFGRTIRYHRPSFVEFFKASQIMPVRRPRRSRET
jgi:Helix-turn-helix domain